MPSMSRNGFPRRWSVGATGVAVPLFAALPAAAHPSDTCPTWLPDFQCEGHGRYEGFVAPMSIPYLFEYPFITTALKFATLRRGFPDESVLEGGGATVLALQARVAIADRLAFVATRDGVAFLSPGLPFLRDEDGIMDIPTGSRGALLDRPGHEFIPAPSLPFEIPSGDPDILQDRGDPA